MIKARVGELEADALDAEIVGYHFRRGEQGLLVWDVERLIELSQGLPRAEVELATVRELDEPYWFRETANEPTCRAVVEHMQLIKDADPSFPIILSADGRVMDGMHRVAKALLAGRSTVLAVRFERDPEPDYLNRPAGDLPY